MATSGEPQTNESSDEKLANLRALIDLAVASASEKPRFHLTVQKLDELEKTARRDDWLECTIPLNRLYQKRATRTVAKLNELRKLRIAENAEPDFERFHGVVKAVLHPNYLNIHGYMPVLAGFDPDDIWAHLRAGANSVAALGYPVFINSGTLLGAIREGGLIAHDYDADLALILKAETPEDAAIEWIALFEQMLAEGHIDAKDQTNSDREIMKLRAVEGMHIDLFPGWIRDGKVYVYPHTWGDLADSDVLPLKPSPFAGMLMPAKPEKMLEVNYGAGWRTPDPLFHFDWSHAQKRFAPFRKAMAKLRATGQTTA